MPTFSIRLAGRQDVDFLWSMLFEAAHMQEAGETLEEARSKPGLAAYVEGWGRTGDMAFLAEASDGERLGAVWIRLMQGYGHVRDDIPELAIGVLPGHVGRGIGTALMARIIEQARTLHPGISLSVRESNPAYRLYQRLGFEVLEETRKPNRVGTMSVVMLLMWG